MTTIKPNVSLAEINGAFSKIYHAVDAKFLTPIEAEMRKIVPSNESEVLIKIGMNITDNEIAMTFFVSKPLPQAQVQNLTFDVMLQKLLMKTDATILPHIYDCLYHLENKGERYEFDAIEAQYDEELTDYVFYLFIHKV